MYAVYDYQYLSHHVEDQAIEVKYCFVPLSHDMTTLLINCLILVIMLLILDWVVSNDK